MAAMKYTYSIAEDFPNQLVSPDRLTLEIQESAIVTALDFIGTSGDVCDIWFKDALTAGDQTILDSIVAAHSGEILPDVAQTVIIDEPKSPSGIPRNEPQPREGSSLVVVTHNWCDPTTWFGDSERVTAETLTTSDDIVFDSVNDHWIDLTHGKFYGEDKVNAPYLPKVYVDNVQAQERTPWAATGGDFEINYTTGKVTFFTAQTGKTVTADYNHENGSTFYVRPAGGKVLVIENSEVQFSKNLAMNDTINFQPWAYNPADLPNKVPVGAATVYKTIRDFVDEARGVYPVVPVIGGLARGLSNEHVVFPYNYKTVKELVASFGVEIRVWLSENAVFGGEFATATFYCTSKSEE
ncbi:MAG: hypothetical protein DRJ03_01795 [Chloroflexi bacterium]|nr:MAG: hypothetical protein DRJ03_01795 [Chloroflexota bacterium]